MKIYRFLFILLAIFTFGFATISQSHAASPAECTFTRTLTPGSANDPATNDVLNLRMFLVRVGFLDSSSSAGNNFGPTVITALTAYQAARGLTADGIFGPITRSAVTTECLGGNQSAGATYRLVTSTSGTGSGTVLGAGVYNSGALVTLTATPNTNSVFSGWNNGRASGKSRTYPFVITEDQVANAIFDNPQSNNNNPGNNNPGNNNPGATYSFTTYLNDATSANDSTPGRVNSSGSISGSQSGTKTVAGNTVVTGTYPAGTVMTLTATPGPDSMFLTWFGGSTCVGGNPTCTFTLNGNGGTEAVFKAYPVGGTSTQYEFNRLVAVKAYHPYGLGTDTVNPIGGTIVGSNVGQYSVGTLLTVRATANPGYRFIGWTNNGLNNQTALNGGKCHNQGADCSFVLDNNVILYAVFTPINVNDNNNNPTVKTLTYTAGSNGSIAGSLSQTVNSGSNGTPVTAVANSGYRFVNWSDGYTSNPRTDSSVTSNISVTANFVAVTADNNTGVTYNLDVTKAGKAAAYGSVTSMGTNAEGRTSYAAGSRVTLTAAITDTSIAKFAGWNDGNVCSGRSMTCTFTINGNETAKANFDFIDPTRTSMFSSPSAIYAAIKSALNLQKGSVQSGVAALQRYLNTKGYIVNETPGAAGSPGNESTYFGEKTEQAVVKFQQDNGLPATGVVGLQTKEVMKAK